MNINSFEVKIDILNYLLSVEVAIQSKIYKEVRKYTIQTIKSHLEQLEDKLLVISNRKGVSKQYYIPEERKQDVALLLQIYKKLFLAD